MARKEKSDRRFNLTSLLGFVTLIAVSLGLIRFGGEIGGEAFGASEFAGALLTVGALWLAAAIGAAGGFVIGGRKAVVAGAIVGMLLLILGFWYWALPTTH